MHLPFHIPKWVAVSLVVAVVGVVGGKMHHHHHDPSNSTGHPLASALALDDPSQTSPSGTTHVAGRVPAPYGKPSGDSSGDSSDKGSPPAGRSPVGGGVHISATTARDGSWHVVGGRAPYPDPAAPSTGDARGSGGGSAGYSSS